MEPKPKAPTHEGGEEPAPKPAPQSTDPGGMVSAPDREPQKPGGMIGEG